MSDLIFYGVALTVAGYVFATWLADLKEYGSLAEGRARGRNKPETTTTTSDGDGQPERDRAKPHPATFPGAVPASATAIVVAALGALGLLAVEIGGEKGLGITAEQTNMTILFGVYTLAAAFVEELIFRGYLYYDRGTRWQLIASIVAVSMLFAVFHPYMWKWSMPTGAPSWQFWRGSLSADLGTKAVFSTSIVFARSLWFYCVRFWPANPLRSLIPCIIAHLTTNAGVLLIKAWQGYIQGWF